MIQYSDKKIIVEGKEIDLKGLNTSHVVWHLSEIYHPETLLHNINESYSIPEHIHYMSLAEGTDFDALLIDDRMFRMNKLTEEDMNEVQDYINKYAYATALLKLTECTKFLGSGLRHTFDKVEESYSFISKAYDKLFENISITHEAGRLNESFNGKLKVLEGNNNYIREIKSKRIVENWQDTFNHKNITSYVVESVNEVNNNTVIRFIDKDGAILEAVYKNTKTKLVESNINLDYFLKKSNLVESYRVGTLNEYQQPFTLSHATITSYNAETNGVVMFGVMDSFGNSGTLPIYIKIPNKDFISKYGKQIDTILKVMTFGEGVDLTSQFLNDAEIDIEKIGKIKNMKTVERTKENQTLSYKVAGFTPVDGELPTVFKSSKDTFSVRATKDGKMYNIRYLFTGVGTVDDFIDEITPEVDDYDFTSKSEIISFFQLMDDYGDVMKSYPTGISTKERNYKRNAKEEGEIMESEGVQVSDIAPKTDQNVGLVKIKMKKKKKVTESEIIDFDKNDLLINTINEQDEFYGSRGFIKDEQGHYHFGDYYINESGKVVHKSRLSEEFWNEDGETEYKGVKISIEKSDKGKKCYIPLRNDIFIPERGTQFFKLKDAKDYIDSKLGNTLTEDQSTVDVDIARLADKNKFRKEVYKESNLKDYYVPKYRCVSAGYETISTFDSKEEAISFAKENKQVCSILVDYYTDGKLVRVGTSAIWSKYDESNLTEDQATADEAYYKVNDVSLKLQEVKPYIEEGSEAEKIYSSIMVELNDLQMNLHSKLLKEDMSDSEMVERLKQGIQEGLNKSSSMSDIAGVIDYYRTFIKGYMGEGNIEDLTKQGMCPYCTKKLTDTDKWYIDKYGMCQDCFENGVE